MFMFGVFACIMIGQIRADRKWSGREMGAGSIGKGPIGTPVSASSYDILIRAAQ